MTPELARRIISLDNLIYNLLQNKEAGLNKKDLEELKKIKLEIYGDTRVKTSIEKEMVLHA